jgi:hypothetical protein
MHCGAATGTCRMRREAISCVQLFSTDGFLNASAQVCCLCVWRHSLRLMERAQPAQRIRRIGVIIGGPTEADPESAFRIAAFTKGRRSLVGLRGAKCTSIIVGREQYGGYSQVWVRIGCTGPRYYSCVWYSNPKLVVPGHLQFANHLRQCD